MKRHQFDTVSFIAGALIAGVGLLFLIPFASRDLIGLAARWAVWIWPVLFLFVGAAVLVPAFTRRDNQDSDHST